MLNQEDDRYIERNLKLGPYQYQGSSIGGERTYHGFQNLKTCFDLGLAALSTTNLNFVFITHGHADHCGGVIQHLWRRHVRRLPMSQYFAQPDDAVLLQEIVDVSCQLSRNDPVGNVFTVMTDEPVQINQKLFVSKFNSVHRVPCTGYLISERRRKLNPDYQNFAEKDLQDLRRAGIDLNVDVYHPEIAFTGDTSIEVFDKNPFLLETRILITECTGLDDKMDRDKVQKHGHIHLDHLVEYFKDHEFQGEKLVLGHFSARYSSSYCKQMILEKLTPVMGEGISKIEVI